MLIEFTVTNYRSIKERQVLSMLPAGRIKKETLPENLIDETSNQYHLNLLKSTILYGANASGKSNLLKAFHTLHQLVIHSADYKVGEGIPLYDPFKLDKNTEKQPTVLSIDFIAKDNYRYLYTIAFTAQKFVEESLFFYPKLKKTKLFVRENETISYGEKFEGNKQVGFYENQLLLSKVGTNPITSLIEPYLLIKNRMVVYFLDQLTFNHTLINEIGQLLLKAEKLAFSIPPKQFLNEVLKNFATGIEGIKVVKKKTKHTKKEFTDFELFTIHDTYLNNEAFSKIYFNLTEESTGTQNLLLSAFLIYLALMTESLVVIDELDKSLHALLTKKLLNLFTVGNANHAQLIFTTHDVTLLDAALFRRDQIWFAEKDEYGATEFFPLSDFTGISKVKPLEEWYLRGRFGAIPIFDDLRINLNPTKHEENEKIEAQTTIENH